ncbi:sporulation integral membrane protein YtvI [Halalkalibacterium ligniniphilum]|uniref:sporulation integral membrane protein YtvI n=1 Tax=Halalkalibacterium ligniniphilum TaxID=1134413 RepID=UPI00034DF009|nr:sporulation integral membrane protein YtvI [Halalkalibacterium ligniniphilum]
MNNKTLQLIIRVLIVAAIIAIGWLCLFYFFKLTYPFLIAFVLAFFINPVVNFLDEKAKFPRPLAVLAGILFLFGLVGGIVTLIIIKIIDGFHYLSRMIPTQIEMISNRMQTYFNDTIFPFWEEILGEFNNLEESQRTAFEDSISQIGLEFASLLGSLGQAIANYLSSFVGALPITLTAAIFVFIALYFISKDWHTFKKKLKKEMPNHVIDKTVSVVKDLKSKVIGFISAQLILISMTAVLIFVGLLILRVEQPLTIALIIGLVDLLPYLGTGTILVPWAIYSLITGDYFLGFGLLILYGVVILQRQLAEPKVLSSNLGLNPLATLISMFAGLQLFGVLGLVIGPVMLVLLVSLYQAGVLTGVWHYIKGEES